MPKTLWAFAEALLDNIYVLRKRFIDFAMRRQLSSRQPPDIRAARG
jgi:hypothetical protein